MILSHHDLGIRTAVLSDLQDGLVTPAGEVHCGLFLRQSGVPRCSQPGAASGGSRPSDPDLRDWRRAAGDLSTNPAVAETRQENYLETGRSGLPERCPKGAGDRI